MSDTPLVEALRFYACQGNWGPVASYSDGFWYMNGRPWLRAYAALKDAGITVELLGPGRDEEDDEADQLALLQRLYAGLEREAAKNSDIALERGEALERAKGCIKGLLARTPVRDVAETLAEIDHALRGPEGGQIGE